MESMSLRATPRTPMTPRTPRSSKKHSKYEIDNIPSQRFKIGYQKVTLDIDLESNSIIGETEITVLPLDSHLKQVKLDCRGIQIKSIIVNQRRAHFSYDDFLQNIEYMNDEENMVLKDYKYDPYFDSHSKSVGIEQHEMLRAKFFPLFSDQNEPDDPGSSFSKCTSELTIRIPESIKLRLQNANKITISPAGSIRPNETPTTASSFLNSDKAYTPLNIKINYIVKNSKNGVQFYGGKHTTIPRDKWYCFTLNNDIGCSTSSWVPCIDNFYEKPAWDVNIVVPKTVGNIGTSMLIGTKEATKALQKMAAQNMMLADSENKITGSKDQKSETGDDGDEDEDESSDKMEDIPITVVVPELVSSREGPHPMDVAKKLVNFQFYNPVCAHHLGFAVGCFEKTPMVDVKPGTNDFNVHQQMIKQDYADSPIEVSLDASNSNKVPCLLYYHPGRKEEVLNSTIFLYKVFDYYSKEFSSFPFTSFSLLFIDHLPAETCSFAGMAIVSSHLLYGPKHIEPIFDTTEKLCVALAEQYSGVHVLPKTLNDIWCTIGIARYMSYQFMKKLFGTNHYKFLFEKRCELLCDIDIGKRPLANQLFRFPINVDQDLNFINLKAPLVLSILDRRITKTDKLFGLSRVIPKIFLQAMSNDLVNGNNLSTSHFQRVCEKVAHHKLEAFFQNWVYGNGTPIFRITQKFNRKRVFIEMTIRQMQASSLNNDEDNMANKDLVRKDQTLNFVDQANTFLIDHQNLKVQPAFFGPVNIRIHEVDGSPYEHIFSINDSLVKFDIQYNTKYRRKKKEKKEEEELDERDDKEKEIRRKDKNDEPVINTLGDVLTTAEETRNWDLKEDDNDAGIQTGITEEDKGDAFEWLRFDADKEWICKYTINLADEKFEAQLKQDRDVEAQYEAIRHFATVNRPGLFHARVLLRTLIDARYYYGIRVEAAKALAKISSEENDHIGMRFLLKAYKHLYCYDNKIVKGYSELDAHEYLPRPTDFSDFSNLYVSQAILESLSKVKNKSGDAPIELKKIMLNIFKYIDGSTNQFDDTLFHCSLVESLGNLIIASNKEIPSLDLDLQFDIASTPGDICDQFNSSAIQELNRYQKMDEWSPSYNNLITLTVIKQKIRLVTAGLARMSFMDVIKYTTSKYNDDIRLFAFKSLLLLGGFKNRNILHYFFSTMKLDNSPGFRYNLNKTLVECVGIAAYTSLPSLLADEEFLVTPEVNSLKSNRFIQIEHSISRLSSHSRADEIARKSIQSSIEMIRNDLGVGKGLRKELWDTAYSCLVPINTRRNVLDIMMVLYEAKDSFMISTNLPSDKHIVCKVKNKSTDSLDPSSLSYVIALKREPRFKIQLPILKLVGKGDPKKEVEMDDVVSNTENEGLLMSAPILTLSPKKPRKKRAGSVTYENNGNQFNVRIRFHKKNQRNYKRLENPRIISHDPSLPLRYVRFNLRTNTVCVSTNEEFDSLLKQETFNVNIRINSEKWRSYLKKIDSERSIGITEIKTKGGADSELTNLVSFGAHSSEDSKSCSDTQGKLATAKRDSNEVDRSEHTHWEQVNLKNQDGASTTEENFGTPVKLKLSLKPNSEGRAFDHSHEQATSNFASTSSENTTVVSGSRKKSQNSNTVSPKKKQIPKIKLKLK